MKQDLLLSITKNCQTLIEQTQRKAEETLEFKVNKSREAFHFNPPISVEGSWMIGLTSLEVYNSIFNLNTTNSEFELYTDTFDEFSFTELKDELDEIFKTSDNTPHHLQHEKIGPRNIEAYKKLRSEKSNTNGYVIVLMGHARSSFRDFGSYHRIEVGLGEDNIQLISKQYNSNLSPMK